MKGGYVKKGLAIAILLLFIGINIIPSTGSTVVSIKSFTSGNTLYVGGSEPGNYSSIQSAINDAFDGDTVFVYNDSSPYSENVIVDKSINLIGEDKNTTIIDGRGMGYVVKITADEASITGFTFTNGNDGIRVAGMSYTNIAGNNMVNLYNHGVTLVSSSNNIISGNDIAYALHGISLSSSCNNTISNNSVALCQNVGISLKEASNHNDIFNNIILDNDHEGIYIRESSDNFIYKNTISYNIKRHVGIGLSYSWNNTIADNVITSHQEGIQFWYSWNNTICGNIIDNNLDGMEIKNSSNTNITGNIITNNNYGIDISQGSDNNDVILNTIANNSHGILVDLSYKNTISSNNLLNNSQKAGFISYAFVATNQWINNYWNRPRLFPKPIFGVVLIGTDIDLVFPIPWVNFDWYPAREPYEIP